MLCYLGSRSTAGFGHGWFQKFKLNHQDSVPISLCFLTLLSSVFLFLSSSRLILSLPLATPEKRKCLLSRSLWGSLDHVIPTLNCDWGHEAVWLGLAEAGRGSCRFLGIWSLSDGWEKVWQRTEVIATTVCYMKRSWARQKQEEIHWGGNE